MDASQYLEIFVEESKEHLQLLNESLLELEKDPIANKEKINEVFRVAHTLKGMAGTMGYSNMNKLAHIMEDALSAIRDGKVKVDSDLVDTLFSCLDALERYIEVIAESGAEGEQNNEKLISDLRSIVAAADQAETAEEGEAPEEPEVSVVGVSEKIARLDLLTPLSDIERHAIKYAGQEGMAIYGITVYLSTSCLLKSARSFIIFRELEKMGQVLKTIPSTQDIEDEKFEYDFSIMLVSAEPAETIAGKIEAVAEVEKAAIDVVSDLEESAAEAAVEETAAEEARAAATEESKDPAASEILEEAQKHKNKPIANRTVRVDIERLDVLMNLVSELIIIKNGLEIVQSTKQSFEEQIEYLERITTNLHDAVMKVRMVPIDRVFNRFPRLIRDLSRQLEKEIELNMEGEETELDRTVIDEIGDPLVHLIRNSADHGLETPDQRLAAGKDRTGNINLKAYQDGNNVVIEVADDGRGINMGRAVEKAVKNGLISKAEVGDLSEGDIIELLFQPSFSTAESVSDLSGRGVGLDVVKTKIEALGGNVEVKTESGKGSTFVIRLPLTLAIIQALMVLVGNEKFAVPLSSIQTIEEILVADIKYVQNQEVINLRGKVIPIVQLGKRLKVEEVKDNREVITVVIVTKGEKVSGFVVDGLIGQQEIVIKTLGKHLSSIKLIAGATILGNGEVALILDVNKLV